MSFSVSARLRTSSRASGTGRSDGIAVAVTRAAPRRSAPIGRSVEPVTSQIAPVNTRKSTGVKITRARATTLSDPDASLNGTAAITSCPPLAGTTTTRSSDGMSKGAPRTCTAPPPSASARAWATDTIGTSRSASEDTFVIAPEESSTWIVMSSGTGTGLGSPLLALISAWTSTAPDRAESSTDRVSDTRSALKSSRSAAVNAMMRPRAGVSAPRAASPRRRHQRKMTGPSPCPIHSRTMLATVACQQVPRAAHRLHGPPPERRVNLPPQVPDVHLDDVEVGDDIRVVPDVREQLGLGHHGPAAPHQVLKQRELPRGQVHANRTAPHHPGRRVE